MNFRIYPDIHSKNRIFLVVGLCAAGLMGYLVGARGFSYQLVVVTLIMALSLIAFSLGSRGIKVAYLGWIGLFALGYRTLHITSNFSLHPLVVVIWGIFLFIVLDNVALRKTSKLNWRLPKSAPIIVAFCFWGLLLGFYNNIRIDLIAVPFLNFMTFIPIFLVVQTVLKNDLSALPQTICFFFATGTLIAALGCLEYYFPQITRLAPSIFANNTLVVTTGGFVRAPFSFFGSPIATFVCALTLPFGTYLYINYTKLSLRIFIIVASLLMILAIYISGFRVLWIAVSATFIVSALIQRKYGFAVLGIFFVMFVSISAPQTTINRLDTLSSVATGSGTDSSTEVRIDRYVTALNQIERNPQGLGWGSSGWVHNDFLQFGAECGLLGGLFFALWYLITIIRLFRKHNKSRSLILNSLFNSMLIAGAQFMTQPIYELSQLIFPIWFVWAVSEFNLQKA